MGTSDRPRLQSMLTALNLPEVLTFEDGRIVRNAGDWSGRRLEILDILRREIYGHAPAAPAGLTARIVHCQDPAFANKAVQWSLSLQFDTPAGPFAFPLTLIIPKNIKKPPVFLAIAFRPDIPDQYLPAEEIIDHGYAIASFCYQDITADAGDGFQGGLPALYPRDPETGWGKIAIWAWAASRVMDYLQTRDDIDNRRVAVVGHSRLGKTALWCGAQDERFAMVIANNSGCAGAALNRGKNGERIADITRVFPYWFCGNYRQYAGHEAQLPFDQHFLLALAAPRVLYISSAREDAWADPESEFLAALAVSPVFEILDQAGLVAADQLPVAGTTLHRGRIAYHLRYGSHYLSRLDWQSFITYRNNSQV